MLKLILIILTAICGFAATAIAVFGETFLPGSDDSNFFSRVTFRGRIAIGALTLGLIFGIWNEVLSSGSDAQDSKTLEDLNRKISEQSKELRKERKERQISAAKAEIAEESLAEALKELATPPVELTKKFDQNNKKILSVVRGGRAQIQNLEKNWFSLIEVEVYSNPNDEDSLVARFKMASKSPGIGYDLRDDSPYLFEFTPVTIPKSLKRIQGRMRAGSGYEVKLNMQTCIALSFADSWGGKYEQLYNFRSFPELEFKPTDLRELKHEFETCLKEFETLKQNRLYEFIGWDTQSENWMCRTILIEAGDIDETDEVLRGC